MLSMPIFKLTKDALHALPETAFHAHGVKERADLQRLLRANIGVVAPDVLIIAEEFSEWDDSKRRIDLLGIDRAGNVVVIELKRDDDGGHMELQAIRYAAMVSTMTFARAVEVFHAFLAKTGGNGRADIGVPRPKEHLLEFLGWDEPREDEFARDVRIVLVAADFSKELTTAVLWLNERDLDIRCVRLKPYSNGQEIIVDSQQVVPLPEAGDYQVKVRQQASERREAARQSGEDTGYWFMNTGDSGNGHRSWEDCMKYGFMLAGGGKPWLDQVRKLKVGDKVFAYLSGHGYVGLAEVTAEAVPFKDFVPDGQAKPLPQLPRTAEDQTGRNNDPEEWDACARVRWLCALPREKAVLMNRARNGTVNRIKQPDLVAELLKHFGPDHA
jgi:hypothetical protein